MPAPFPFCSFLDIPSSISIDDSSYPALAFPESTEIILVFSPSVQRVTKKPQEYIATIWPSAASIIVCLDTCIPHPGSLGIILVLPASVEGRGFKL